LRGLTVSAGAASRYSRLLYLYCSPPFPTFIPPTLSRWLLFV